VLGPATLETDILMRTLGIRQAAQAQYDRLPEEARAALQAYSAGVNAFHADRRQALSPEFLLLGIDPAQEARAGTYWDPVDSVGWSLMMALDLGGNWGNEIARLSALQVLDTDRLWELFLPTRVKSARPAPIWPVSTGVWTSTPRRPIGLRPVTRRLRAVGWPRPARTFVSGRPNWATSRAKAPTTGWLAQSARSRANRCWPMTHTWVCRLRRSGTSPGSRRPRSTASKAWM